MKANKKGFELSLNLIIIVIIAVIFLGVAIAIIVKMGTTIDDQIPRIIPPTNALWKPTQENPILFSPSALEIKSGDSKELTLQVYNYEKQDASCTIAFASSDVTADNNVKITHSATTRAIPSNMVGEWRIIVQADKMAPANGFIYTVTVDCGIIKKQSDIMIAIK